MFAAWSPPLEASAHFTEPRPTRRSSRKRATLRKALHLFRFHQARELVAPDWLSCTTERSIHPPLCVAVSRNIDGTHKQFSAVGLDAQRGILLSERIVGGLVQHGGH